MRFRRRSVALALVLCTTALGHASSGAATAPALRLVASSSANGWLAPTDVLVDPPGGRAYDPSDPPYAWVDGEIRYLLTRWSGAVCDGSMRDDIAPDVVLLERDDPAIDGDGLPVRGIVEVLDFNSTKASHRDRIVRFTIADSAYPHGLAAGRHVDATDDDPTNDQPGGGGPFTVEWTVYSRTHNGLCDVSNPTTVTETLAIDRSLPVVRMTSPAAIEPPALIGDAGCVTLQDERSCPLRYTLQRENPVHGRVVIEGTASDPTPPETHATLGPEETSGVALVVVRLFTGSRRVSRMWVFRNTDCSAQHPLVPAIMRCTDAMSFSIDVTDLMRIGSRYGVDAYAIDRAGLRTMTLSDRTGLSNENTNGPPSPGVAWRYMGNA